MSEKREGKREGKIEIEKKEMCESVRKRKKCVKRERSK